ncbi:TIGR03767 family metallophosphoesterase [Microbispora bryophytorum subsp. camponoti]|uniref:TIGR03767 family metallophosphoesterase n=2 Tax=Microbispora bryophytorum TaxID=1460882 RepID=A0ABR8L8Y4_9ACTN|nr:TIGR03767 family metallophosphoesterase [Microbispora camponoti]
MGPALNRRAFLLASGMTASGVALEIALSSAPAASSAVTPSTTRTTTTSTTSTTTTTTTPMTTVHTVAGPRGAGGYRRLSDGPGWRRVTRTELAAAKKDRAERRTPLACFVQFTDLHITDVQNPQRYEFLRAGDMGSWRPQEALTAVGAVSLIEQVNTLRHGPATRAPIGFVMTTGDNTDNNSRIELEWFLTAMTGGRFTPNTGDPGAYEGVQNSGLGLYWQPDSGTRDIDKRAGFPHLDGFLEAAIREVSSPGLAVPWYSTVGNHDQLFGGAYSGAGGFFADLATGSRKLFDLPASEAGAVYRALRRGDPTGARFRALWKRYRGRARTVTADERRAPLSPHAYIAAHLDPAYTGPGPVGHGYTRDNLDSGRLDYSFRIANGVVGISLDTTDRGGDYRGSVGTRQLAWLERTLKTHADDIALIFSHHPSWAMTNLAPNPARPHDRRHGGQELLAVLRKHRNVAAWINGHSHLNKIVPQGGFWEVSTASHVDYPQLARVVELADNHDGTLSLFTTLVESAAPHRTDFTDLSQSGLAALYRELSFNSPGMRSGLAGLPGDRNTELLLKRR